MDERNLTLDSELFLPEPEPAPIFYTLISVDDHLVEPPHVFEGRLPANLQPADPSIIETPEGHQVWEFEGQHFTQVGMNAVAGRCPDTVKIEPFRFEHMRPGCYDPKARIADMDLIGMWASLNFPSAITGFCSRVFFAAKDRELGIACVKAWNDWFYEEWCSEYPDRFIPLGIAYLADPDQSAAEIKRNAARGFRSVSLPERPHAVGLPSLWNTDHWRPIIEACVETDTVISLHVGSSGVIDPPQGAPFVQLGATLFGQLAWELAPNGCGLVTDLNTRS